MKDPTVMFNNWYDTLLEPKRSYVFLVPMILILVCIYSNVRFLELMGVGFLGVACTLAAERARRFGHERMMYALIGLGGCLMGTPPLYLILTLWGTP